MCTSFVHRKHGILIGMNFDNNGMPFSLEPCGAGDAFTVLVDGGWGKMPSFGVTPSGVFANNLLVDPTENGAGAYKRASATRTHTQRLAQQLLAGTPAAAHIPAYLQRMEIVNGPGHSCHNLLVDGHGNAWVVEPGRGVLYSPAAESPFFVMTNCPLYGVGNNPVTGTGADRYATATALLAAMDAPGVEAAFDILRQTAQTQGEWQTAFSMVYSKAERAVYYCYNRQFDQLQKHTFAL